MKIAEKHNVTFETNGQRSTITANNRAMAIEAFETFVRAMNLIAFDPDPSGYLYAHNDDLTIRCWIDPQSIVEDSTNKICLNQKSA